MKSFHSELFCRSTKSLLVFADHRYGSGGLSQSSTEVVIQLTRRKNKERFVNFQLPRTKARLSVVAAAE